MADNQTFYIIQHGIRWSGMPAWSKTLSENQTWQLVTFLSHLKSCRPLPRKSSHRRSLPRQRRRLADLLLRRKSTRCAAPTPARI